MKRILVLMVCLVCCPAIGFGQEKNGSADQDMVFFSQKGPVLFRLSVKVDGQSVPTLIDNYLSQWFDRLDQDKNGQLDATEIQLAPNARTMSQIMRGGYYYPNKNTSLSFNAVKQLGQGGITRDEFLDHYRNGGLGAWQMLRTYMNSQASYGSSEKLFQLLDANGDKKITGKEIISSLERLTGLDSNDDEYIDIQELSGQRFGSGYVYRPQNTVQTSLPKGFYLIDSPQKRVQFTAILLAKYDKNKDVQLSRVESRLNKATFDSLDKNQNHQLDIDELGAWTRRVSPVALQIELGNFKNKSTGVSLTTAEDTLPSGVSVSQSGAESVQCLLDDAQITINCPKSNSAMMSMGAKRFYLQQFTLANRNNKKFLVAADLQDVRFRLLSSIFPIADENGDEKLTEKEVENLVDFLQEGKKGYVSLQFKEEGRALFQLLDANRDNRLSPREILSCWDQLKQMDKNGDGSFTTSEVARQYTLFLSQGTSNYRYMMSRPQLTGSVPQSSGKGPIWFRKMDTNGDGDVSTREFLGSRKVFDQIDSDGDQLIDSGEAEGFNKRFGK